jgi:thioredoxin reductase
MAIDTPARIAVLGAGPIGLEAALYGRYLGYDVDVYDQGRVADNVQRWGHVVMFSPFGMNASPLGLAALAAQDPDYRPPGEGELLTGLDYARRYLLPLSQSDLLSDHLQLQTRVVAVARRGLLKDQPIGGPQRVDAPFELLLETPSGERCASADVVIDATGTYRSPRCLGAGGIPALGERSLRTAIHYHLPDVLGAERAQFMGARTLVVGAGYSAATTVVALAQLAREDTRTQVVWLTRHDTPTPIAPVADDPLPARARLTDAANRLAADPAGPVRHLAGCEVRRLAGRDQGGFEVDVQGQAHERLEVDQVVAHVGYRPDNEIVAELQVHRCYATEGPMKLAASLLGHASADCLAQPTPGIETLLTTEPRYFVLGSKSYGRNSHFLIAHGLQQIRQIYGFLGDRPALNLYARWKSES